MWPGTRRLCHQSRAQHLYVAPSPIHGWGVRAAERLQRDQCYSPELVDNRRIKHFYHYLDCLTMLPAKTQYRCQAMVMLVEEDIEEETLQRGLAVIPRGYVRYLNHTDKKTANAKIGIRINGQVMDFDRWVHDVPGGPGVLKSLAWERPLRDAQPLNTRLAGFSGLRALRKLLQDWNHTIELVIIPIQDIEVHEELLICYGKHDVTQDAMFAAIDVHDKGHLRLLRKQCVCHRKKVRDQDEILEEHMLKLEKLQPRRNQTTHK